MYSNRCVLFGILIFFNPTHGSSSEPETPQAGNDVELAKDGANLRAVTYPCTCAGLQCGCCSGNLMQNFNINMRQRLCANFTYDADDFAVGMKLLFNDRVLYNNKVSGKNPPPVCLPIPRITPARACVRLTNVYIIQRNLHACVVIEAQWNKETAFAMNFDCIRMGADGVAVVRPEDGGGLPHATTPAAPTDPEIEEYDELLENSTPGSAGNHVSTSTHSPNKTKASTKAPTTEST